MKRVGIYPGTFDPITLGHRDIIERSLNIVDKLIVAVAYESPKKPLFTMEERVDLITQETKVLSSSSIIEVRSFKGLLVNFAKQNQARLIIRGLRAVSDFEYEFQLACMNSHLAPTVETLFLPASEQTHFVASSFVKEIARLGGDISHMVSPVVADYVYRKLRPHSEEMVYESE